MLRALVDNHDNYAMELVYIHVYSAPLSLLKG